MSFGDFVEMDFRRRVAPGDRRCAARLQVPRTPDSVSITKMRRGARDDREETR
jgi:hypothetical protein